MTTSTAEAMATAAVHLARGFLLADLPDEALEHFHVALDHGLPGGMSAQLPLLMAEAERCSERGDEREAVQRWQDIASLLGDATPEVIYHRLGEAYAANRVGFGGSDEDNTTWGDCSKHEVLRWLQHTLLPALYLEIGVDQGVSLACSTGPAIGIDPRPGLVLCEPLPPQAQIISCSSDAFFADEAMASLSTAPELAFIDGMHLFEFALRDLLNCERTMAPWGLVVIDDIYPCQPVQASRRRRSGAWTGDVWKLVPILRQHRPDLTMVCLNTHTTGLLLLAGLDPGAAGPWRQALADRYDEVVRKYRPLTSPPVEVIERHGAIPSYHKLVGELVEKLRQARCGQWSTAMLQEVLAPLKPQINAAEEMYLGLAASLSR
ncbi:MAG: class I SAM-dependent methyltransferase [Synechococcus sp.]